MGRRLVFRLGTRLGSLVDCETDWPASSASISRASPSKLPSATFFTVRRYLCQAPLPAAVAVSTTWVVPPDARPPVLGATTVYHTAPPTATLTAARAQSARVRSCCPR